MNLSKIDTSIYKVIGVLLLLTFAGCFMELFRIYHTGHIGYMFLIWNLFLAWISLVVAMVIHYVWFIPHRNKKIISLTFLGFIWLIFYPNAPYMITDFIHLRIINFRVSGASYVMSYLAWYDFLMFCLFIFTGALVGFISLFIVHKLIRQLFSNFVTWFIVAGILFLSSFGIYLGRFIRWNTWDIMMDPGGLVKSIWSNSYDFMFAFTFMFGLFLLLIYAAFYSLTLLRLK